MGRSDLLGRFGGLAYGLRLESGIADRESRELA